MKNQFSSLRNKIEINKMLRNIKISNVDPVHDLAKEEMEQLARIMKEFRNQPEKPDEYCLKVQQDIDAIRNELIRSLTALNTWKHLHNSLNESCGHLGVAVFTRMIVLQNALYYLYDFEIRELNHCLEFMWAQTFSRFIVDYYTRLNPGNCNLKINLRDDKAWAEWAYQQKVCAEMTLLFNEKRVGMYYDSFIKAIASKLFMPEVPSYFGAFTELSGSMEWPPLNVVYKLRKGSYATAEEYKNFGVTVSGPEKLSIPEDSLERLKQALNDSYTEHPFLVITTGAEKPSASENDKRMQNVVQYVEFLKDNGILFAEFGSRRPASDPTRLGFMGHDGVDHKPFTVVDKQVDFGSRRPANDQVNKEVLQKLEEIAKTEETKE